MNSTPIKAAAHILYNEYGATRVILFGSLAHDAWFTLDSDIESWLKESGTTFGVHGKLLKRSSVIAASI